MVSCQPAYEPPVHLLRKRIVRITGSKSRLNVRYRCLVMKSRERSGQSRGRISLNDYRLGRFLAHDRLKTSQHTSAHFIGRLLTLHDLQIEIWFNLK